MSGSTQLDNLPPENSLSSTPHSFRLLNTSSNDETNKIRSDDETNKTRSDDETNKTRSDDETNKTRSDDETNKTRSDDETNRTTRHRDQSLDGGWGWVVLFGSFYITTFLINITVCFGILFSQKMTALSASSTDVSIIFSTHSILWNFGTLLTNSLVNKFGNRSVAFWGCFVASISFMLLAFSSSVTYVFFMYSIVLAISGGIGSTVCFFLVPQYFDRRRGLAMAVIMTGIAFGGIINPLIIRALQDEYGFFGGCLLHGAIISNCCVAAALYRPPPKINENMERNSLLDNDKKNPKSSCEKTSTNPLIRTLTSSAKQTSKWIIKKVIAMREFRVLLMAFSISTIMVGFFNFLMLVPFYVESIGYSPNFSAQCVATFSVTNTCARLVVAFVSDRSWFNRRTFFVFGVFLLTASTFAFISVSFSSHLITVVMLSGGLGVGLYMSLVHINLIDILGMELYPEVIGVNSIIMAITFAVAGPVFGLLRDLSGSYSLSIYACASLQLCSALLLLPLPLAVSRDRRMQLKRQANTSKE